MRGLPDLILMHSDASAFSLKRTTSLLKPVFQNSIKYIKFVVQVKESFLHFLLIVKKHILASLYQTQKLEVICENVLHNTLLIKAVGVLRKKDFEHTVLTLVYRTDLITP
uniref:Uncharacterized protein n=1 Tax=Electrophorus electricus TaxID=8005 RepID=A0AAY5F3A2_ELEEL